MKFAVVLLACLAAASAQFNRNQQYYQPSYQPKPFGQYQRPTPAPFRAYPTVAPTYAPVVYTTPAPAFVPVAGNAPRYVQDARNAEILKYGNEIAPDGSYNYFYETNNGIAAQEQGTPRNFGGNPPVIPDVAQGSFRWTSPEGKTVSISYVADENGYQPTGDAIPQPPPVPEPIARALEYIARTNGIKK